MSACSQMVQRERCYVQSLQLSVILMIGEKIYREKKISTAGFGPCNKLQTLNMSMCGRMGVRGIILELVYSDRSFPPGAFALAIPPLGISAPNPHTAGSFLSFRSQLNVTSPARPSLTTQLAGATEHSFTLLCFHSLHSTDTQWFMLKFFLFVC